MARRSHRSFVSYIDKSREYYAAQGYEQPYEWAVADNVPFAVPSRSLETSRVGVVTTSYFPHGEEPQGVPTIGGTERISTKAAYAAPSEAAERATHTQDLFWAKDETHTDDVGSYLPVGNLRRLADEGKIGAVSPRFYGVPTEYSQRRTRERDAPLIETWMREDGVDLAILVGL